MAKKSRAAKPIVEDPDDAPKLDEDWFDVAELKTDERPVYRGGRPKAAVTKEAINIRLSPDVLAAFRATGPGWQRRIDEALTLFIEEHPERLVPLPLPRLAGR